MSKKQTIFAVIVVAILLAQTIILLKTYQIVELRTYVIQWNVKELANSNPAVIQYRYKKDQILKNAKKALRVSERKNIVNRKVKSQVKTAIDQAIKEPSQENLAKASSKIDRAVKKNLMHKNKAARVKSRLAKLKSKSS